MDEIAATERLIRMAIALAVGLTIGLERGWKERDAPEGSRVAGWRTFGLVGLAGGLLADLAGASPVAFALALATVAAVIVAAEWRHPPNGDRSATTTIAIIVTFALGGLAGAGHQVEAAAGAVVTAIVLSAKSVLHDWLKRMDEREFRALLQFLLIAVVVLPLLPNEGYGPGGALNPRRIWTFVVILAGLSFAGYAAMRIWGERAGTLLTAALGGVVASTAVTIDFSRRAGRGLSTPRLLAAGIVIASGVSFVRTAVLVGIFEIRLLPAVIGPLAAMSALSAFLTWLLWRRAPHQTAEAPVRNLGNPLELGAAIRLGLVLAVILALFEWLRGQVGTTGLAALSALSGLADIDATTISLCRLVGEGMEVGPASLMLLAGLAANAILKLAVAAVVGGTALALWVGGSFAAMAATGAAVAFAWTMLA